MTQRKFYISLQTKIASLVILLLLLVIFILASIFAYFESNQIRAHMGQLAIQTAKTVSLLSSVEEAFELEDPSSVLQPLAEQVRNEVGAAFIVIANKDGIQYSHPYESEIGNNIKANDYYKAIVYGAYYISNSEGIIGPSLTSKAPIYREYDNYQQMIGVVTVGYLLKDIESAVMNNVFKVFGVSFLVLIIGLFGSILLARNIRKDTLGLEPQEISALYRERNAILLSIKEGIIAIDETGHITLMNKSAQIMLNLSEQYLHQHIKHVFSEIDMISILKTGKYIINEEVMLQGKVFILNCTPVIEDERIVGVVSTFRDKTELIHIINTLSEVKQYSEWLRAQTHEYTNKLYALSGLLQLEYFEEAVEMIQQESHIHKNQNRIIFDQIRDSKLQAILLGKISKASELKINFTIDANTSIEQTPKYISISQLITIVGNLIDNAFDAVSQQNVREVSFFAIDMGRDLIIEVSDNGSGIQEEYLEKIFEKGFSTKKANGRGYGLTNVKDVVIELDGTIQAENKKDSGAIFTVYIPKKEEKA